MRKFLFVLAGLTFLTACGQNGALYLPEDAKPSTNSSTQENASPATDTESTSPKQSTASDK